jgi:hypothetical protein
MTDAGIFDAKRRLTGRLYEPAATQPDEGEDTIGIHNSSSLRCVSK